MELPGQLKARRGIQDITRLGDDHIVRKRKCGNKSSELLKIQAAMIVNYMTTNQPGEEECGSKEEECVAPPIG